LVHHLFTHKFKEKDYEEDYFTHDADVYFCSHC